MSLIFSGNNPEIAVKLLYENNILLNTFKFPDNCKDLPNDPLEWNNKTFESFKYIQIMVCLYNLFLKDPLILGKSLTLTEKSYLLFLALILPYERYAYTKKGKQQKVYEYIISEGYKVSIVCIIETRCICKVSKGLL